MEEERIAKTFLSTILQRAVISIKICQDGFRNIKSNSISIFKMGFVASIKNNENSNELTNIRLYKTWVDTDVLEPRQHLAWQRYIEEKNSDGMEDESLPTISVFLLAHRIGDFETPVACPAPGNIIIQLPIISKTQNSSQKKVSSNPQPIGFSGILLAKRQNSFYCTYFLHNRNVADTKSPYPIKRLEVIRWFNQKSMVFNQSLS